MKTKQVSMVSAAVIALIAAPAYAQDTTSGSDEAAEAGDAGSDEAAEAGDTNGIPVITVTARRRAESAQTVPIAVTVVTDDALTEHQVVNAYQLVNLTPSLQVQSAALASGAVNFTIRGIGTTTVGPQVESSVGIVIDDVPMSRPQFGAIQFYDLDRVEVLRGPQGMLFGKNAAAGLINITTAQPRLERTEFLANVQYGNSTAPGPGNLFTLQSAVNLPIGEDAALRVSGFMNRQDAFVKDLARHDDLGLTQFGGRAKLLWQASPSVRLTLAGDYQYTNGLGEGVIVPRYTAPGGLIDAINDSNGIQASTENALFAGSARNFFHSEVYGGALKAEVDVGAGYTITNVFAHRVYRSDVGIETDVTTANLFDTNIGGYRYRQTTEEIRLTSPSDRRLSFQLGLFYLDLSARQFLTQGANLGNPVPPGLSLLGGYLDTTSPTKSYAGFVEGQFRVTDNLRVTGGARYTHDNVRSITTITQPFSILPLYPPVDYDVRVEENNFSYRVGLDYDVNPDVFVYFTHARGYKGPSFDQISGSVVDPEIPTSYEVGVKSTLFDRRLQLNVALFDTTFEGYQTSAQQPGTAAGFKNINAGELKTRGVEVEFTALPFDGLTISGGTTYNFTEYRDLPGIPCYYGQPVGTSGTNVCLPDGTTNVSGNQLYNAPRWTTSVTARYERPISGDWLAFLQGDIYNRSSFYFSQTRDPQTFSKPNSIIGLSAGTKTADDRFTITAFVRNLLDKRVASYVLADPVATVYTGATGETDAALGGNYFQNLGPNSFRTIGVALSYRM